jgi:hypothetical protein
VQRCKEKQTRAAFNPPEFIEVKPDRSVSVTQTKLNQSGRNDRAGDLSESRGRSDVNPTRETKYRMVPHVEHIHAKTQLMAFLDAGRLDY